MRIESLCLAAATLFFSCGVASAQSGSGDKASGAPPTGFAVVELFTSQGCSSCPPADRVLSRVAEIAGERDMPVYALSMHVDYWNYLGWQDPYSAEAFTNRQRAYATAAKSRRVYTPQMIVNGDAAGFNGSNGAAASKAIRQGLQSKPSVELTIDVQPADTAGVWRVSYQANGAAPGDRVVACLVADSVPNDVSRGENAGRQLVHAGVVRAMEQQPIGQAGTGTLTLTWPKVQNPSTAPPTVVAFVQDARSMAIHGATGWRGKKDAE
ncbi:MAG: DUF1223 domain-containing protein [Planctomycetota bacterium]